MSTRFALSNVYSAMAEAMPDRVAARRGNTTRTYRQLVDRADRLAAALAAWGLGSPGPAEERPDYQTGQHHLGILLNNSVEFLEVVLGTCRSRAVPASLNYAQTSSELRARLVDLAPRVIVFHKRLGSKVIDAVSGLDALPLLLVVDDESDGPAVEGAVDYEQFLAAGELPVRIDPVRPSDAFLLYTGGTTGTPKAVIWGQHELFMAALGGAIPGRAPAGSLGQVIDRALAAKPAAWLPTTPLMHAGGLWVAFQCLTNGGTVVFPTDTTRLDAAGVWDAVERHSVAVLSGVGNAVATSLLDELDRGPRDVSTVRLYTNGGAALSEELRSRLVAAIPGLRVRDTYGASETGPQLTATTAPRGPERTYPPAVDTVVLSEDRDSLLPPGHEGVGWLAQTGCIPRGYLNCPDETAEVFRSIHGRRVAVTGDRAILRADATIAVLGRDAQVINSGGEKVFAEEVEQALLRTPHVRDAVVLGRPSRRWGSKVVAVVVAGDGDEAMQTGELTQQLSRTIARYKLPKDYLFVDAIERAATGKVDYSWADTVCRGLNDD